jgi:phosphoribosylaminoimidazolecarboxamide formyltransferase / IMP cyclohydrolase
MKNALISVSDKTNLSQLCSKLVEYGYEIFSTGGTLDYLIHNRIKVNSIEELTHFPQMLDGRVKTLHPNIHAGILFRRNQSDHRSTIFEHNIAPIDLVIVNLYPFEDTIRNKNSSFEDAIENIDIGGPAMLRSAAKNFNDVTVLCDPNDYDELLSQLSVNQTTTLEFRRAMATKVFQHTASYDALIAQYLTTDLFPLTLTQTYKKVMDLRYGENPHQEAAFYQTRLAESNSIASIKQIHGKALSYNNILDANAALSILCEFSEPCCVVVKHTNPCGVGKALTIHEAWKKAYEADPISIFGGIVAFNEEVNEDIAKDLTELFLEIILAPSFNSEALNILSTKKNIRLLQTIKDDNPAMKMTSSRVTGGLLVQTVDNIHIDIDTCEVVCGSMDEHTWNDCLFAMKVCKHVKSNAIVIAKDGKTLGIGGGQSNRIGAAKIALEQSFSHSQGAVLASDAFFPMPDTVELAASYGIKTIIQPGGSIKDQLSIDACNKYGITMIFTHIRHFKHG